MHTFHKLDQKILIYLIFPETKKVFDYFFRNHPALFLIHPEKAEQHEKASLGHTNLYGQAGAGSIENDIRIGLRANLLKQFSRLSSQQELPHCAEILEKRILRRVVVY